MKKADLLFVNILALAYAPFVLQKISMPLIQCLIAFLLIFIFPGYILLKMMNTYSSKMSFAEVIALCTGISIVIIELIGIILNYTVGINHVYYYLAILIFICGLSVAIYKKRICHQNDDRNEECKNEKIIHYLLLVFLSIPVTVVYFIKGLTQEYIYRHWAFAELFKNQNHIDPFVNVGTNSYDFSFVWLYPGHDIFLISLLNFFGLESRIMQYIPIINIFLVLIFYVLLKQLSGSNITSFAIAFITMTLDLAFSLQLGIISYYSLSVLFFLTFVKLFWDYLNSNDMQIIILMTILFIGAFFVHHRVPVWIILTMVGYNLFNAIFNYSKQAKIKLTCFYLLVCFIVVYLGFNKVIYKNYFPIVATLSSLGGIDTLIYFINDLLKSSHTDLDKYMYPSHPHIFFSRLYSITTISKYFVILTPTIFYIGNSLLRFSKKKKNSTNKQIALVLLFYALLFTMVVEYVAYFILGRVSFVYYSIIMPILSLISIYLLNGSPKIKNYVKIVFVVAIFVLSSIKFADAYKVNFNMLQIKYNQISSGSNWLKKNAYSNTYLISDFRLWGMFLLDGSRDNYFPRYRYYTSDLYAGIIKGGQDLEKNEIFIIDKIEMDRPIVSMFWRYFKPYSMYYDQILNNKSLIKNYNDGKVEFYNTV
ncbi:MAG: DUF1616 domain-containing protein [Bacillota bacterium]